MIRTSDTHPLQIDTLKVAGRPGLIGLTFCPRKKQDHAATGAWYRDLNKDLGSILNWGATLLVTLMEQHELDALDVGDLGLKAEQSGLGWFHLPIVDIDVPDHGFEKKWQDKGPKLHDLISAGGRCVLHCKGGLGRTGTIAARLLVESGMSSDVAILTVREARPGTIETQEQERYIHQLAR